MALLITVVLLLALILIAAVFIVTYNNLVVLRNRVRNAWAQIDVQLKRRHDLIPNLVEVAKRYMAHEKDTLESVIKARTQAINVSSDDVKAKAQAENFLSQTLRSLFAVSENYPELKADRQMAQLNEELVSTENRIAFARQFYNDEATLFNTRLQQFPTNVIGDMLSFRPFDLFEADEESKEAVKVDFS